MGVKRNLGGHVRLEIEGIALEEVINQAVQMELTIWDIHRKGKKAELCVALEDFRALVRLIRPYRCRVHILSRHGLPFWLSKIKKRQGLVIGAGLFFVLAYLATSFVWSYEVVGNERFSNGQLIAIVQGYGILPGTSLHNVDFDQAGEKLLEDYPDTLGWADVTHHGTKVIIKVQERDALAANNAQPAHLVALRSGIVKEILVMQGVARVQKEQEVQAGDVLIAGVTYERREKQEDGTYDWSGPPIYIRAKGIVEGYVDYQATAVCPMEETLLEETGATEKNVALIGPKHTFQIWGDSEKRPFSVFRQVSHTRNLISWQNYKSSWRLRSTTYIEEQPVTISRTLEEAYQEAVERAREKVAAKVGADSVLVRESIQVIESAANVVEVQMTWRVMENMAVPQFIAN